MITEAMRIEWEALTRAKEARSVYGRTVEDLLRLLKRAKVVRLTVRVGRETDDRPVEFVTTTPAALRKMLKYEPAGKVMPSDFDPVERELCVGSLRAIFNHRDHKEDACSTTA
ncbi:hypothetical protein [Bradyrhizobium sp. JYMT SZCCT0428]|uniref:hypothetical protein n=1 Tax=Bradyrhizobium sp. JYMT SZCCT0428 TaxID=2807673 RepID=UPI001BAD5A57|nr:hypothetical protein [Bradyrhizobium sp. JYMT SZCCT0428]MBR1150132.1 hypothetical protein [Bradyrhizobium sp. JYMT SZCCT0428]